MVKGNGLGCLNCFNARSASVKSYVVDEEPESLPVVEKSITVPTVLPNTAAPLQVVPAPVSSALEILKTIPAPAPITVPGSGPEINIATATAPPANPPTPSPLDCQLALHDAARLNRTELLHQIINDKRCDVNVVDTRKRTPLHIACLAGSVAAAKALIQMGADLSAEDEMGRTPYLAAAFAPTASLFPVLVDAKADVDARDMEGNSALHLACWNGNIPVVKFLLENGGDVTATNQDRQTPLHKAAEQNEFEVVNRLVWAGAAVDEPDQIGNTALHIAARLGNTDVARYLLRHGAKLMALNKSKKTPGDVAMDEDMRKLLYDQEIAEMTSRLPENIAMHPPKAPASVKSMAGSVKSMAGSVTHSVELPGTPGQESKKEGRRVIDDHSSIYDFSVDMSTQSGSTTTVHTRKSAHSIKSTTSLNLGLDSFVHPREMEQFTLLNSHEHYHMDPALKEYANFMASNASASPPGSRGPSPARSRSPPALRRSTSPSPMRTSGNPKAATNAVRASAPERSLKLDIKGVQRASVPSAFPRGNPPPVRVRAPASTNASITPSHSQSLANSPVSSLRTPVSQFSKRDRSPLASARSKASTVKTPISTTSTSRHASRGRTPAQHFDIMSTHQSSVSDTALQGKQSPVQTRHRRSSSTSTITRSSSLTRHAVHDIPEDKPVTGGFENTQFIKDAGFLNASMNKSTRSRAASVTSRASSRGLSPSPLRGSSLYNAQEGARAANANKKGVRPRGVWVP